MEIMRIVGQLRNQDFGTHMITMGQHGNHEDSGTVAWKLGLWDTHGYNLGQHEIKTMPHHGNMSNAQVQLF
jgi:hypothetical protein